MRHNRALHHKGRHLDDRAAGPGRKLLARSLLLLASLFAASCHDGGSDAPLLYLAAADGAGCDRIRLSADLSALPAAPGSVQCSVAEPARELGCTLRHLETNDDGIVAVIDGCENADGAALLACAFSGAAPSAAALEAASHATCACGCDDGCAASPPMCVESNATVYCPSDVVAHADEQRPHDTTIGPAGWSDSLRTTCRTVFGLTSSETVGSIQVEVDPSDPRVEFVGVFGNVECASVVEGTIASFYHAPASGMLTAGIITLDGAQGPTDLFECNVTANGHRQASEMGNFAVTVVDATDPDLQPIQPAVALTAIDSCEHSTTNSTIHDVSSTTTSSTSTTTTTTSSTTTTSPPPTSTTTTTEPGNDAKFRVVLDSPSALSAATVSTQLQSAHTLTSCGLLAGGPDGEVSHDDDSLTACFYFAEPLPAGARAVLECSFEGSGPLSAQVDVQGALDEHLVTVPGAQATVRVVD